VAGDVLRGQDGNDLVNGRSGDDFIVGGTGIDLVSKDDARTTPKRLSKCHRPRLRGGS
jgi:hypothetical protein